MVETPRILHSVPVEDVSLFKLGHGPYVACIATSALTADHTQPRHITEQTRLRRPHRYRTLKREVDLRPEATAQL